MASSAELRSAARVQDGVEVPLPLVGRLFARAGADRWQLPMDRFADTLRRSACQHFRTGRPTRAELEDYLQSLHLEDLALASACAAGSESAWEHFVREFRPILHAAARAIGGASAAPELADAIYAELYGATPGATPETRRSLFDYFHGRSKLSTWLRAVMAQRHVDQLRAARRLEGLDDRDDTQGLLEAGRIRPETPLDPDRQRYLTLLHDALAAELLALPPRDRLRLSYYYLQELTLAQIGRLLGEHEATVSRKLDRTRHALRRQVECRLRDPRGEGRLSEAQVQVCFQYAVEEWHFDLSRPLAVPQATEPGLREP